MPWAVGDVDRFKKGLTDKQKRQWVAIANSALARCLKDGRSQDICEASAIKQASASVKENDMIKRIAQVAQSAIETATAITNGSKELTPETATRLLEALQSDLDAALAEAVTEAEGEAQETETSQPAVAEMDKVTVVEVLEWLLEQIGDKEEEPETPEGDEEKEPATPDDEKTSEAAELSESASGAALSLVEFEPAAIGARAPLMLDVVLIEPGWGNETDNNYYPREMLEEHAGIFEGAKMYTTDHRADEKNVRTEVAIVKQCPVRFTDTGAPVARVAIHDGDFAEATRNRAELGTLGTLECSILAQGLGRPGFEKDGRAGQLVEAITKVQSVDWVTSAGAGGHAHNIAESGGDGMENKEDKGAEQGQEQKTQETPALSAETVTSLLAETALPEAAQRKLAEAEYADEGKVKEAAEAHLAYLKEVTDSGKPVAPTGKRPQQAAVSEADVQKRFDAIDRQHGLYVKEAE